MVRAALTDAPNKEGDGGKVMLDISERNLETLANLGSLISPQTKSLNISNNKLSSLNDLLPMFQLLNFNASYNMIVQIDQVLPFPKLQTLNLSHNRIVRLTCAIPLSLRTLDLSHNNIYSIDLIAPVLSLKALESLDIRGNPLMEQKAYQDIISNFPQLGTFNGRAVQDFYPQSGEKAELTLSELTDRHSHNAASTHKPKPKLVIDEQVILFSRSGAPTSQIARHRVAAHSLTSNLASEQAGKSTLPSPTSAAPPQSVDRATTPNYHPTYADAEFQTDMSYKDMRRRTMYDFSDEDDDAAISISDTPDANEAKRLKRVKALLKNSEQIVDSTYIHTLQGQLQSYKQNEERLRGEVDALEQQLEKLRASNALLQSAVRPVETISSTERQNFMLSSQIDEVIFLREQVKILDELLNRQEAASAVQFPVPEAIPEYLSTLNAYRRKLFHVMFDLRQLKYTKENVDVSCLIAPALDDTHGPLHKLEADLISIAEEKDQLSAKHDEVLNKLTVSEHAARAFHDEATKYLSILLRIQTGLKADPRTSKLDGLDEHMSKRICAYMNTSKAPTLDDAQKYILAASESASYRLAAQCSVLETVIDRINDILSENQVIKEEKIQLCQELAVLTQERNELKEDNLLLKGTLRQQREEKARLEELRASGYLDKAILCTEIDLGEIVHGSTQTYLDEFFNHIEIQADPQEFLVSKSVQFVRELFNVDDETQTGNLRELTNYNNSQFDTLPASTPASVEHVEDDADDEDYQRLLQLKDIHDRSKGTDCTIIPSSILLKLHIDTAGEDTPESVLDAAIRSLLSTQPSTLIKENMFGGESAKLDGNERIHTGIQVETPLPVFKAVQCELLQTINGTGDSIVPRYKSYSEGHESELSSVEDATTTVVFAAIQVDAPDMKYFGTQTDEVDVAPYGTLAALQLRMSNSEEKLTVVLDTKVASTQCEEIAIVFRSVQCPEPELHDTPKNDSLVSDASDAYSTALSDPKNLTLGQNMCAETSVQTDESLTYLQQKPHISNVPLDEVLIRVTPIPDTAASRDMQTCPFCNKEFLVSGSTPIKEEIDLPNERNSPCISRMYSPPPSPYLREMEYECCCNTAAEQLHKQAQVLAARELELEDMNEVVSEVMKTISSAENKVSSYKKKLQDSQDTISNLQDAIAQLQGDLTSAEAKGTEHEARVRDLEKLLHVEDGEEHLDAEIQTRLNLVDMKLLFAQMRVATSSTSTQYESQLTVLRDHNEVLDSSVVVHNLSSEDIKRSLVSKNCSASKMVSKSEELRASLFEPAVIPLTPPLSTPSSSDGEGSLETSFRSSPFVSLKIETAGSGCGRDGTTVSVFHPSNNALKRPKQPPEKSSVRVQIAKLPHEESETRVRFFCAPDSYGARPVIVH